MLIACPACASEYTIDATRLGSAGRSVRCASCRETWFITPAEVAEAAFDDTAADSGGETAAATMLPTPANDASPQLQSYPGGTEASGPVVDQPMPPRRAMTAKPKKPRRRLSPALAAGLVVFVAVPLGLLGRATVVRAMPQTASLFSAIGLPVNLRGVDLRDVVAFQNPAEGDQPPQLVVEGDLVGAARERIDVPPLELVIQDANAQPVYRWTVPPPRATLEPGERARFRANLTAPPAQGREVLVTFVSLEPTAKPADASAAPPSAAPPAAAPEAHPAPASAPAAKADDHGH